MKTDDLILFGGGLLLAYFLTRQPVTQAAAVPQAAATLSLSPVVSGGWAWNTCCGARLEAPAAPSTTNQATTPQVQPAQVPQWFLDKLSQITQALNASNLAGTWEKSWKIAAERDAWIASQGLLPTQWEAYV